MFFRLTLISLILQQIAKVQPLFTSVMCSTSEIAKYRRRDEISHFMLRMACSMTVDLTQRFIARELELFKFRFSLETESSIIGLLEENKVKLEVVSADEVKKFEWELWNANRIPKESVKSTNFYKLRFTDCRVLVRMRKVFLHNGYCYVTIKDLIVFLTQKFRLILSSSMHV
jgi:DNA primase large subunit